MQLTCNFYLAEVKAFEKIQQELSLTPDADLVLRGNRLIIPKQLRTQVIHMKATKVLLRPRNYCARKYGLLVLKI